MSLLVKPPILSLYLNENGSFLTWRLGSSTGLSSSMIVLFLPVQMSSWSLNIRTLFLRLMCCKTFDPFSIFIRTAVFAVITYFPMCSYHDKGPIKILATLIFSPHKRVHNASVAHKASDYFISVRWLRTMFEQGKRVEVSWTTPIRYTLTITVELIYRLGLQNN